MNHASVLLATLFTSVAIAMGCTVPRHRQADTLPAALEPPTTAEGEATVLATNQAIGFPLTLTEITKALAQEEAAEEKFEATEENDSSALHDPSPQMLASIGRAELGPGTSASRWHVPPKTQPSKTPDGRPRLILETINTLERIELSPTRDDGGFTTADIQLASYLLRDRQANEICALDPRVLDLAYRVQRHFEATAVRVLSACRVSRRRPSNHSRGRAVDLVIPGFSNAQVARFARAFGFVGVGVYPNGGFIHLDTRPNSYFWVDTSRSGERSRSRPILASLAAKVDAEAVARGETPPTMTPQAPTEVAEAATDGRTFHTSTLRARRFE